MISFVKYIVPLFTNVQTIFTLVDISNYEFCEIKKSKFEVSKVHISMLQRYRD